MKTTIPDHLKADLPPTKWGKTIGMTPIVLTVVATLLAGIASSEMTKAQYDRSMAAQLQSKAGDQWGYFQAKKLRGALQQNTLELLAATADLTVLDTTPLTPLLATLKITPAEPVLAALTRTALPTAPVSAELKTGVKSALEALSANKAEPEVESNLLQVTDDDLTESMATARAQALAFDTVIKPVNSDLDHLEKALSKPGEDKTLLRNFTAARLRFGVARYDQEARLNQTVANVFELQVRKANMAADRHRRRSGRFFYGMLGAQMGVIISTFAIAARQKSLLWSLAAAAGLIAVSFSAYVFLSM